MSAQFIHGMVNGDPGATAFMADVMTVFDLWEALARGEVSGEQAQAGMWAAMIDLPQNPFYRQHFERLHPVVVNAVLQSMSARTLEMRARLTPSALTGQEWSAAFVARQGWAQLLLQCAVLTHGPGAAAQLGPAIFLFACGPGFTAYRANHERPEQERSAAPSDPAAARDGG